MKSMRFLSLIFVGLTMMACGAKDAPTTVPNDNKTTGAVGPYDMIFSGENDSKLNSFSVEINQDGGAVDFFAAADPATQYLVLDSYTTSVTGCDAKNVKVSALWYANEAVNNPVFVSSGKTMQVTAGRRGILRFVFQQLQGCQHLDFSVVVKKLPIGPLIPQIDSKIMGTWNYGTAPGLTITMFMGPSRLGWLEGQGTTWTCDTEMYPSSSPEIGGGWLVSSGGTMLCRYTLDADSKGLQMNCYGSNYYGCTVPKNLHFQKN